MHEEILTALAGIILLGVTAQWIAWRLRLPSILLLLLFGLLAGPVTGRLDPDGLFGSLLLPAVSMAVAVILYEGGLTLKVSELRKVGGVMVTLITAGALVTWLAASIAVHSVFKLDGSLAVLLGAVLVVTGPTVVTPLLRHIRPTGRVGSILKWEGIVIDPIGALLAVLIFEVVLIGNAQEATVHVFWAIVKTMFVGGGFGALAAFLLVMAIQRNWVADHLENAVSLMLVLGAFALSNHIQPESGLFAATLMGFALANQRRADIEHIVEFKENLQVLLLSTLFIVLAARVNGRDLLALAPRGLLFAAMLIVLVRPLAVFISTIGSTLAMRERAFIAWMAPRGIVAAAVSSVFALRLREAGYPGSEVIVPVTFITIIVTVAVYSLTAPGLARRLGVAEANPQGVLFAGAHPWSRSVAQLLQREGFRVLMVDTNRENTQAARMAGLPVYGDSILAESALDRMDLGGLGKLLAVTPNDWVNVLAVHRFERIFGRANCYQLPPQERGRKTQTRYLHGRWLFGETESWVQLESLAAAGHVPKATRMSEEFDFAAFRQHHGDNAVPLFIIDTARRLQVITPDRAAEPKAGETLISLVLERGSKGPVATAANAGDSSGDPVDAPSAVARGA